MAAQIEVKGLGGFRYELRGVLPDFMGLASVVSGLLASRGISIELGSIRTGEGRAVVWFVVTADPAPDWDEICRGLREFESRVSEGRIEEVREDVNLRLIDYLRTHEEVYSDRYTPVQLRIDQKNSSGATVIDIEAPDAPAFLFEITNALALVGINIQAMEIRTEEGRVRDRLWITNESGQKIASDLKLRSIQWAILLMKHFTHLLPKVPDPAAALQKFVLFGKNLFQREDFDRVLLLLKKSDALEGLSKMLGTSLYLWEELIRLQHEPIYRLMGDRKLLKGRKPRSRMRAELKARLDAERDFKGKKDALNDFKDHEMFRIDLRHLLGKTSYLEEFAGEFTDLAEALIEKARQLAWDKTLKKFRRPRVSKRVLSRDAVLALGKFGGRELGYASDLELMFVYTDDPALKSARKRDNLAFYTEFVRCFKEIIRARREGVFEIDARLRPYGNAGPAAVSFEVFKHYYATGATARNFERQALVKLRVVWGPASIRKKIEEVRDAFVYAPAPFDFKEALELRERQRRELVEEGCMNAKYSAGGLLDVEYAVQTLQIAHGRTHASARSPNTLMALQALKECGAVSRAEYLSLRSCYIFLRDLINALRIFRGSAKDLTMPPEDSREFVVLARRAGHAGADEKVRKTFEHQTKRMFGEAAAFYDSIMTRVKVAQDRRVFLGLNQLAALKDMLIPDAILDGAPSAFHLAADPDLALENLQSFFGTFRESDIFWGKTVRSEDEFRLLLKILGEGRYLARVLIGQPGLWNELRNEPQLSTRAFFRSIAGSRVARLSLEELRLFRHAEAVRIALAEFVRGENLEAVYNATSTLAERVLERMLGLFLKGRNLCVMGLGKLGAGELNFSSDIDLMFLAEGEKDVPGFLDDLQLFIKRLTEGGPEAFLYRVDLRLRPRGYLGPYFLSRRGFLEYYRSEAAQWEYQALIKARPVAGKKSWGRAFLKGVQPMIFRPVWNAADLGTIRAIKRRYEEAVRERGEDEIDIKMGTGGMRDAEFTVQMIQLRHGHKDPALRNPNMFGALRAIEKNGLLSDADIRLLEEAYSFFRRIENRLQIYENEQTFLLPVDTARLRALARSLGFTDQSGKKSEEAFRERFAGLRSRLKELCEKVFYENAFIC